METLTFYYFEFISVMHLITECLQRFYRKDQEILMCLLNTFGTYFPVNNIWRLLGHTL